mmetsp:Transcript_68440/g.164328  ORF Transcript_68440/g.164328 Transcript_68440/m.164328 type:complete len:365 (-) Transcript_68440:57-1151(-)
MVGPAWIRPKEELRGRIPVKSERYVKQETLASRTAVASSQPRVTARVVDWQRVSGWLVPTGEIPADLKPLLEAQQNRIYVNWRDVRTRSKIVEGMMVDCFISADSAGLIATDVTAHIEDSSAASGTIAAGAPERQAEIIEVLEEHWARQDDMLGEVVEEGQGPDTFDEDRGAADSTGELLPGWEEHWSEEHKRPYYWHTSSHQASWERPAMPVDEDAQPQASVAAGKIIDIESLPITPLTPMPGPPGRHTPGGLMKVKTAADAAKSELLAPPLPKVLRRNAVAPGLQTDISEAAAVARPSPAPSRRPPSAAPSRRQPSPAPSRAPSVAPSQAPSLAAHRGQPRLPKRPAAATIQPLPAKWQRTS